MEVLNILSHVPSSCPRHSVHRSRGRRKAWLISFNFDRLSALPSRVSFFVENLPIGCDTTYKASWVVRTIWIAQQCHQTTHLWFCGAAKVWVRNGRKSCSNPFSKPWKFLIYYPMSPRAIPRHSIHGSRWRLKTWLIVFNFDRFSAPPCPVIFFVENLPVGCDTIYNASWVLCTIWIAPECHQTIHLWFCGAAMEWPETVVKVVLMPV